jgi:hypothetical protein
MKMLGCALSIEKHGIYIVFMQFSSECDFIAVNEFSLGFVNAFHGLT